MTITAGTFLTFGSPVDIIDYVAKQLSNYTYTFPRANSICHSNCSRFALTDGQASGPNGLMMRTRPYRNDRIINAIRGLYFSGGAKSFVKQFQYLFPIYDTHKGEVREVPIHMVALVATAVHCLFYLFVYVLCSLLSYLQAVCGNLRVVHRRTTDPGVLSQCLFGSPCRPTCRNTR